jgi:uncharacterized protein YukE
MITNELPAEAGISGSVGSVCGSVTGCSWLTGGLGSGGGMAALSATMRPTDAVAAAGLGWLTPNVQPFQDVLDRLAGNASVIQSFADAWQRAADTVEQVGQQVSRSASATAAQWSGTAADRYRGRAGEIAENLGGSATAFRTVSTVATTMGEVVAGARSQVNELINDLVTRLVSYVQQATAVEGGVTSNVMAQATNLINSYAGPVADVENKLLQTVGNLEPVLTGGSQSPVRLALLERQPSDIPGRPPVTLPPGRTPQPTLPPGLPGLGGPKVKPPGPAGALLLLLQVLAALLGWEDVEEHTPIRPQPSPLPQPTPPGTGPQGTPPGTPSTQQPGTPPVEQPGTPLPQNPPGPGPEGTPPGTPPMQQPGTPLPRPDLPTEPTPPAPPGTGTQGTPPGTPPAQQPATPPRQEPGTPSQVVPPPGTPPQVTPLPGTPPQAVPPPGTPLPSPEAPGSTPSPPQSPPDHTPPQLGEQPPTEPKPGPDDSPGGQPAPTEPPAGREQEAERLKRAMELETRIETLANEKLWNDLQGLDLTSPDADNKLAEIEKSVDIAEEGPQPGTEIDPDAPTKSTVMPEPEHFANGKFAHEFIELYRSELTTSEIPAKFAEDVAAGRIITLDQMPDGLVKELELGKTARIDRLGDGVIYELKPNTESSIEEGLKQRERYENLANNKSLHGRQDWKSVIVIYDWEALRGLLQRP